MYIITFYSFKGGVGRTLALVNVGAELARRGRKVLLVDFDLEAPGLETFARLRSPKPHPGIVEFVTEYERTMHAPDVREYIYEAASVGKKGGRLWVMPAGRRDANYQAALVNIDWKRLYGERDGFLLFEDAKAQWEHEFQPDYVLIDSRTGHTDVEGICTRQLADSVVLMFMPNEQNLIGLEGVCRTIRREATEGLQKTIPLHFVAANVPNVDDEERILHRQIQAFRRRLAFKKFSGVIRRYENLHLLDQSIFTLEHPHTRLARSYRRLLRTLLKDNLADRDGALLFLQDYPERMETRDEGKKMLCTVHREGEDVENDSAVEDKKGLHKIAELFNDDVDILNRVAGRFMEEQAYKSTRSVLDRILRLEPNRAYSLFERAVCKTHLVEIDEAANDLLTCLRAFGLPDDRPPTDLPRGVRGLDAFGRSLHDSGLRQECIARLCAMAPAKMAKLAEMVETQEIRGVELSTLTDYLCRREEGVPIAARLLRNHIASTDGWTKAAGLVTELLQARCWPEVIQLHESGASSLLELALAHWGESGEMPEPLCRQALESDEATLHRWGLQAVAMLLWRVGEVAEALELLDETKLKTHAETEEVFSWWRLRYVSADQYLDDCHLFRRMIQGEPLRPAFLGEAPQKTARTRAARSED